MYDSAPDTKAHINRVWSLMAKVRLNLRERAERHDQSKLESPEKELFDEHTPKLRALTYGSDEYQASLRELGVALQHHYAHNSHHPEHFADGIEGMSLLDLIEMVCDWKAATERHADGDIRQSLAVNADRFGISPQLVRILANTIDELFSDL